MSELPVGPLDGLLGLVELFFHFRVAETRRSEPLDLFFGGELRRAAAAFPGLLHELVEVHPPLGHHLPEPSFHLSLSGHGVGFRFFCKILDFGQVVDAELGCLRRFFGDELVRVQAQVFDPFPGLLPFPFRPSGQVLCEDTFLFLSGLHEGGKPGLLTGGDQVFFVQNVKVALLLVNSL